MNDTDVLIAGAGPTGLLLGLWLVRQGMRVRIVDPKPGPTRETRAIAVQARTLEFYDQLGLGKEALGRGRTFSQLSLWARGQAVGRVQLRDVGEDLTPHPYLYILTQNENEAMLLSHLEAHGGRVEWSTELLDFGQDETGVSARLSSGESVRAAYLAGCDGASSRVRHALGVSFPGGTYAQTFYVADVTATGKLRQGDLNLGLDSERFLAFFPMPGQTISDQDRYRIVGLLPEGAGEHPTFETVRPDTEAHGLAHIREVHWFSTYRVHHRVADHFRSGRVFLLGDAAHVHTPVGGQGMNTGLGDAVNLAWKLAQVVQCGHSELLGTFEPERRPFALGLVSTTDRVFDVIVRRTNFARFVRTQAIPFIFPLLTRFRAVRRVLFLTVSQTRIEYRSSALSRGQAGRIRGGDRLPWVHAGGHSNFESLQSLRWQVHVYGVPGPELLAWCARRELALNVFAFGRAAKRAGLREDAVYLVRPDGYVGLAADQFGETEFGTYAGHWLPGPDTQRPSQTPRTLAAD